MSDVPVPAHLAVFVEALGEDGAIDFLLTFGGGELSIGADPRPTNPIARHMGVDAARALAAVSHRIPREIPLGRRWLVKVLTSRGLSQSEIARKLRMAVRTVRRHQNDEHDPNQLSLFD